MSLSRRDFLKVSGAGVGGALLWGSLGLERGLAASLRPSSTEGGKAMLYDASKCVGCRACQVACKRWNKLSPESYGTPILYENPRDISERTWTLIKLAELSDGSKKELLFCKYQCMHCADASCIAVCPTGAAHKEGGSTIIDPDWCIGCGYCVAACPFEAVHRSERDGTGTAQKCTFCIDRRAQGLEPACAEACPAGALLYGERAALVAQGRNRVQALIASGRPNARLYGETELGGLGVMYVLPERASAFGLPEAPRLATANVFAQWLVGLVTAGVLAAVPFWLLSRRRRGIEMGSGTE